MGKPVQDDLDGMLRDLERDRPGALLDVEERAAASKAASELRRLRRTLRISRSELARRSGVTAALIATYENHNFRAHELRMLARIARSVGWQWTFRLDTAKGGK